MNWEQIKGIVERIALVGITYAVSRGWLPEAISGDIVTAIVLVGGVLWGWKVNTPTDLAKAAEATKK